MLPAILFCILLILIYVNYEIRRRKLCEIIDKFDGPRTIPIFGNCHLILTTSATETFHIIRKLVEPYPHREPIRFWQFHVPYIWIRDPDDIRVVSKISHKDNTYLFLKEILGEGLVTTNGKKWKENRSTLEPLLNTSLLHEYYIPIFLKESRLLIKELAQGEENKCINLFPFITKAVLMSICESVLGFCEELDNMVNCVITNKSSEVVMKRMYNFLLYPNFSFKMYLMLTGNQHVYESLRQPFVKVLLKRKQLLKAMKNVNNAANEKGRSILDILLNKHDLSDKYIVDEIITLLFAGMETTTITMCFTLFMLAENEKFQERVYEELQDVFGSSDRPPSMDNLSKLTFLDQCIKETLRKFPVIPQLLRCPSQDIRLKDNRIIPVGTKIVASIYDVHHDPRYYADPHGWNPFHFNADRVKNLPLYSFVPFGFGTRNCVGYKYAMMSMKIVLSSVLRKFEFSTSEIGLDLSIGMILQSKNGYYVKLRRRGDQDYHSN